MTVETEHAREQYLVQFDGEFNFGFNFPIFVDSDLKVYRTPVGQASNPPVDILSLNIDYTVNILEQSGSIDIILTSVETKTGDIITIERDVPVIRTYDFSIGGKITGELLDYQYDKATMERAQNKSLISNRGVTYLVTDQLTEDDTSIPKLGANQYWVKNNEGHFVAGECTDTDGCSTLRSELSSQTPAAPGTDNVGYYDVVEGNQTLTTKLSNLAPQKDDRGLVKNSTDETKIAKMNVSAISTGTTRNIYMPDNDVYLKSENNLLSPYYIRGLGIANDVGDTAYDILTKIGICRDALNQIDINLTTPIIKQIDANWAEGTNQGGFPSGLTLTANTWYDTFVISKNDGTVDCGYDIDRNAVNLLADSNSAGYVYYRRTGSIYVKTDMSIYQFVQFVDNERRIYHWNPTFIIYNQANPGATAVLVDTQTPINLNTIQLINFYIEQTGADHTFEAYISCPDIPDEVPSRVNAPLGSIVLSAGALTSEHIGNYFEIRANASGQIRFRLSAAYPNDTVKIASLGWKEYL